MARITDLDSARTVADSDEEEAATLAKQRGRRDALDPDEDEEEDIPDLRAARKSLSPRKGAKSNGGSTPRLPTTNALVGDEDEDEEEEAPKTARAGKADEDQDDEGDNDEEQDEYEIEAVRDHKYTGKGARKRLHYLIKWKGYPEADNTWEPEENTENSKEAVDQYWKKLQAQSETKGKKRRAGEDAKHSTPVKGSTGSAAKRQRSSKVEEDVDQGDEEDEEETSRIESVGGSSTTKGAGAGRRTASNSRKSGAAAVSTAASSTRASARATANNEDLYESVLDPSKPRPWNASELASYDGAPPATTSSGPSSASRGARGAGPTGLGRAPGGLGNGGYLTAAEELEAERKERELRQHFAKYKDWDKIVERVDTLERSEGDGYLAFLVFKSGDRLCYPSVLANRRCPQKMLEFYEDHIRFKHPSDDEQAEPGADSEGATAEPSTSTATMVTAPNPNNEVSRDGAGAVPDAAQTAAVAAKVVAGAVDAATDVVLQASSQRANGTDAGSATTRPDAAGAPQVTGTVTNAEVDGDAEMEALEAAL